MRPHGIIPLLQRVVLFTIIVVLDHRHGGRRQQSIRRGEDDREGRGHAEGRALSHEPPIFQDRHGGSRPLLQRNVDHGGFKLGVFEPEQLVGFLRRLVLVAWIQKGLLVLPEAARYHVAGLRQRNPAAAYASWKSCLVIS